MEAKPLSLVFVCGDDWEGLYIDGRKEIDGHSVHWSEVLTALGMEHRVRGISQEWLERHGLPELLVDVPEEE